MREVYRQGDVVLVRLSDKTDEQVFSNTRYIGERLEIKGENGHNHTLNGSVYEHPNQRNVNIVVLDKPSTLVHDEHKNIDLPVGTYLAYTVREYTDSGGRRWND